MSEGYYDEENIDESLDETTDDSVKWIRPIREEDKIHISPRFDEKLNVKYIIIETGYNNRALSKKQCIKVMRDKMQYFSECRLEELEETFVNNEDDCITNEIKDGEIFIVPPEPHIRLLYTKHNGYTWIDQEIKNPIYYNANDKYYICKAVIPKLYDIDQGSFVFELSETTEIMFKDILNFANELCEMKFCGFYHPSTLYKVDYYPTRNTIVFKYDTESG